MYVMCEDNEWDERKKKKKKYGEQSFRGHDEPALTDWYTRSAVIHLYFSVYVLPPKRSH